MTHQGKASVYRTRPRFDSWGLNFTVRYEDEIVKSEAVIREIVDYVGARVGFGDFRPRFGRFVVKKAK